MGQVQPQIKSLSRHNKLPFFFFFLVQTVFCSKLHHHIITISEQQILTGSFLWMGSMNVAPLSSLKCLCRVDRRAAATQPVGSTSPGRCCNCDSKTWCCVYWGNKGSQSGGSTAPLAVCCEQPREKHMHSALTPDNHWACSYEMITWSSACSQLSSALGDLVVRCTTTESELCEPQLI